MIFYIFYVLLNLSDSFCIIIFGTQFILGVFQIFFYLLCFKIGAKFIVDSSVLKRKFHSRRDKLSIFISFCFKFHIYLLI